LRTLPYGNNNTLRERLSRIQRVYELLLLASEAGVSPRELEALQEKSLG
jgi:chromosome segregation and condensation protein ScpB